MYVKQNSKSDKQPSYNAPQLSRNTLRSHGKCDPSNNRMWFDRSWLYLHSRTDLSWHTSDAVPSHKPNFHNYDKSINQIFKWFGKRKKLFLCKSLQYNSLRTYGNMTRRQPIDRQKSVPLGSSYTTVRKDVKLRFDAHIQHVQDDIKLCFSAIRRKVRNNLKLQMRYATNHNITRYSPQWLKPMTQTYFRTNLLWFIPTTTIGLITASQYCAPMWPVHEARRNPGVKHYLRHLPCESLNFTHKSKKTVNYSKSQVATARRHCRLLFNAVGDEFEKTVNYGNWPRELKTTKSSKTDDKLRTPACAQHTNN